MHLTYDKLFAFSLGAPKYSWIFSEGTSNSAVVAVGLKKSVSIEVKSSKCVNGRLMLVDFEYSGENLWVINLYAPNNLTSHKVFFQEVHNYLLPSQTFLLGDFNSVLDPSGQANRQIDSSS